MTIYNYNNVLSNIFIKYIIKHGKKSLAYRIFYRAIKNIKQETGINPLSVLRQTVFMITPNVSVKKGIHINRLILQIPFEIGSTKGKKISICWLLKIPSKYFSLCKDKNMSFILSYKILHIYKKYI
uniref:ribosomal protein S7 n=1 Tax=Pogoniopsis schenckii TaxID=1582014 RepID=UPI002238BA6A|nr:ribosomal protein S7 [Pogoniopsis schenckii]YP_010555033.1 ribosomal protein S7 [Pogoniopsis schenckii]UYP51012.1 ribosomal protein S7 [Pogoniopsis schenckii]UYP51013.1 ribosomal protein S7 [Pogoniopsis schenckii]